MLLNIDKLSVVFHDRETAFEAVDDPTEFIVLPENFIQKIYGTTIYQPWMEEKLLL